MMKLDIAPGMRDGDWKLIDEALTTFEIKGGKVTFDITRPAIAQESALEGVLKNDAAGEVLGDLAELYDRDLRDLSTREARRRRRSRAQQVSAALPKTWAKVFLSQAPDVLEAHTYWWFAVAVVFLAWWANTPSP